MGRYADVEPGRCNFAHYPGRTLTQVYLKAGSGWRANAEVGRMEVRSAPTSVTGVPRSTSRKPTKHRGA